MLVLLRIRVCHSCDGGIYMQQYAERLKELDRIETRNERQKRWQQRFAGANGCVVCGDSIDP